MPRRSWATAEQIKWLELHTASFIEARKTGKTSSWFPPIYQEWFDNFPLDSPTADEVAAADGDQAKAESRKLKDRKDQIYWWFQNHNRGSTAGKGHAKVLDLATKKRVLQPYQAYLRLHGQRVLPVVEERWKADVEETGEANERLKLAFVAKVAREMLLAESEEVQEEVEKYRTLGEALVAKESDLTPEQLKTRAYQSAIDSIPRTLQVALQNLHEQTGWVGTVLVGGPDPRSGVFNTYIYHHGTTVNANERWDQVTEGWEEIENSFAEFMPKCYAPSAAEELHAQYLSCLSRQTTPNLSDASSSNAGPRTEDKAASPAPAAVAEDKTQPEDAGEDLEELRLQTIAANRQLLEDLGLSNARLGDLPPERAPKPKRVKPASLAPREKPVSTRQLRSRQNDMPLAATNDAGPTAAETTPASSSDSIPTFTPDAQPLTPDAQPLTPDDLLELRPPNTPENLSASSSTESSSAIAAEERESTPVAELPEWISTAIVHFKKIEAGICWNDLLDTWVSYETRLGFPDGTKRANWIPSKNRPDEVAWWLGRGRQYDRMPEIRDARQFGEAWKAWWRILQPEWRVWSWPPGQTQPDEVEWGLVHRGGCNAVFLVIMALSWWLTAAGDVVDKEDANRAVVDVAWVISSMHKVRKRPNEEQGGVEKKKRRKR